MSKPAKPNQVRKSKQIAIPKFKQLKAHLRQLEAGLREANAKLKEDSRAAAIATLEAVMKFLDSVPPLNAQNLATSLWALQAVLKDLNHGRVVAMLAPTQKGRSRRPDGALNGPAERAVIAMIQAIEQEEQAAIKATETNPYADMRDRDLARALAAFITNEARPTY